jgi:hypothetical protein
LAWQILTATGFAAPVPLFGVALATVVLYRDGRIEHVGPLTVQPAIPVILLVPLLLSIGCAVAHSTWRSPVVHRCLRVQVARAASYLAAVFISACVAALGGWLAEGDLMSGTMRNLLWMVGATITTTALIGITYAWLPVIIACGAGLLSTPSQNAWTLHGLLFHPQATDSQVRFAALTCAVGLAMGIWDPVSRGYLRQGRLRNSRQHPLR